jgi:hypothetical protein
MFAFDRSALAVLAPLALLIAVAAWSNRPISRPMDRGGQVAAAQAAVDPPGQQRQHREAAQTVAANLPSR